MNTIPTVTKNLLIINVLMFLGTIVAQSYDISAARRECFVLQRGVLDLCGQ